MNLPELKTFTVRFGTQLGRARGKWRKLCSPLRNLHFSAPFLDIQLNVKGCKTLRDSFANYIDVETLDGENKYQAEGHGLQVG